MPDGYDNRWEVDIMCLSTAFKSSDPDTILMEYVSRIDVDGNTIILTDVLGEKREIEGTIKMVDLTGGKVEIIC